MEEDDACSSIAGDKTSEIEGKWLPDRTLISYASQTSAQEVEQPVEDEKINSENIDTEESEAEKMEDEESSASFTENLVIPTQPCLLTDSSHHSSKKSSQESIVCDLSSLSDWDKNETANEGRLCKVHLPELLRYHGELTTSDYYSNTSSRTSWESVSKLEVDELPSEDERIYCDILEEKSLGPLSKKSTFVIEKDETGYFEILNRIKKFKSDVKNTKKPISTFKTSNHKIQKEKSEPKMSFKKRAVAPKNVRRITEETFNLDSNVISYKLSSKHFITEGWTNQESEPGPCDTCEDKTAEGGNLDKTLHKKENSRRFGSIHTSHFVKFYSTGAKFAEGFAASDYMVFYESGNVALVNCKASDDCYFILFYDDFEGPNSLVGVYSSWEGITIYSTNKEFVKNELRIHMTKSAAFQIAEGLIPIDWQAKAAQTKRRIYKNISPHMSMHISQHDVSVHLHCGGESHMINLDLQQTEPNRAFLRKDHRLFKKSKTLLSKINKVIP